jgi:hypothetical protein
MRNLADMMFDLFGPNFNKELRRDLGRMMGQGRPSQPLFEGFDYLPDKQSRWFAFFSFIVGGIYFASSMKDKEDYVRLFKFLGLSMDDAVKLSDLTLTNAFKPTGGVYDMRGGPVLARMALIFRSYWNPIMSSLKGVLGRGVSRIPGAMRSVGIPVGATIATNELISPDAGDDKFMGFDLPWGAGRQPDGKDGTPSLPLFYEGQLQTDEPGQTTPPNVGLNNLTRPQIDLEDSATAALAVEMEDLGRAIMTALSLDSDRSVDHEFKRRLESFVIRGVGLDPSYRSAELNPIKEAIYSEQSRPAVAAVKEIATKGGHVKEAVKKFFSPSVDGSFLNPVDLVRNIVIDRR